MITLPLITITWLLMIAILYRDIREKQDWLVSLLAVVIWSGTEIWQIFQRL